MCMHCISPPSCIYMNEYEGRVWCVTLPTFSHFFSSSFRLCLFHLFVRIIFLSYNENVRFETATFFEKVRFFLFFIWNIYFQTERHHFTLCTITLKSGKYFTTRRYFIMAGEKRWKSVSPKCVYVIATPLYYTHYKYNMITIHVQCCGLHWMLRKELITWGHTISWQ